MYVSSENWYQSGMIYNCCGRSGLKLPAISLGFWHNFGSVDVYEAGCATVQAVLNLNFSAEKQEQIDLICK